MQLAIGSDHAGFELKNKIIKWLNEKGYSITDFGPFSSESVDYPDFIHPVAEAVVSGKVSMGIVICGSGNGAAITANKHKGIRAAICWNKELSELARQHNNANILSLPARFISADLAKEIVEIFLHTDFEGGRHQKRVEKIE